jgi:hypothetical protein
MELRKGKERSIYPNRWDGHEEDAVRFDNDLTDGHFIARVEAEFIET